MERHAVCLDLTQFLAPESVDTMECTRLVLDMVNVEKLEIVFSLQERVLTSAVQ